MKKPCTLFVAACLLATGLSAQTKPILIIETDIGGDKDDQGSLTRLLLHSNELDIRAIICDRPADQFVVDPNRWNPSPSTITNGVQMAQHYINAYDQVDENLRLHDAGFPTAATLRSRVYAGYPGNNAGRDRIISVVDGLSGSEVVYYSNWGSNTVQTVGETLFIESSLERAYDKVLADRGETGLRTFVSKIRHVTLDGNSNRHGTVNLRTGYHDVIRANSMHIETGWPVVSNARWYHRFQPVTKSAGGFIMTNDVSDAHGALAPLYRGAGQKEGDSWSTLYVLPLGVSDLTQPTWGGPAGRYLPRTSGATNCQGVPFYWNEASDTWNGSTSRDNTAARFAAAVQNSFRARWDWCYMTFAEANHEPVVTLKVNGANAVTNGIRRLSLAKGSTVNLSASATDPDSGDTVTYKWVYYPEAGTYTGSLALSNSTGADTSFTLPNDAAGKQIHVYVEATDNGSRKGNRVPNLSKFCRVVIDVTNSTTPEEPPPSGGVTYIEAESATRSLPWVAVEDSSASGGQYCVVPEGTGDFLTTPPTSGALDFTFTHAASGPIYVSVRTYETSASGNRSDSLYIDIVEDGLAVASWTTFPTVDQWVWSSWTTGKPTTLAAGTYTLRLRHREDGFRVDRVAISPTALTSLP